MKIKAFTLAETLIVIGIIGVVAALTLPNLNHATGDKEKVTRVMKIYSALTEAVDRAQVIYGPCDEWITDIEDDNEAISERFAKRITEFMKVSKECGFEEGCFASSSLYDYANNDDIGNYLDGLKSYTTYMVMLSDGTSLGFHNYMNVGVKFRVDIDGPNKGKTAIGNDIFDFTLYYKPYCSSKNEVIPSSCEAYGDSFSNQYETMWVVKHGNLDYLKASSGQQGWKCNDSEKILDGITNTSCH